MLIVLRVRSLYTGEATLETLPDESAALKWLSQRPRFLEVLGTKPGEEIPADLTAKLRAAARPLDPEELVTRHRLEARLAEDEELKAMERRRQELEAARAHRETMATLDPLRPMEVNYRFDRTELAIVDESDDRAISPEAAEAVMAWVAERASWVRSRRQVVGEAKVVVYPGALPGKAHGERVLSGTFIPITAPSDE